MQVGGDFKTEHAGERAQQPAGLRRGGDEGGDLGQGTMQPLLAFDADTWLFPMPRALDHGAPGDWTLAFRRDGAGGVAGVTVGCWLARGLVFDRIT